MSTYLYLARLSFTINMEDVPDEFHSSDAFFSLKDAEEFMKKSIEIDLVDFIKHSTPFNPQDISALESHPNVHYLFEIVSKSSCIDKFKDDLDDYELDKQMRQIMISCVGDKQLFYYGLLDRAEYNVDTYDLSGNLIDSMIVLNYHCDRPWGRADILELKTD